jgi:hypothetical protein
MNTHKNARLTPKGREEAARAAVDGELRNAAAARKYNTAPKTVANLPRRWRGFARPILKAPFISKPNRPCHGRRRREIASPAPHPVASPR